MSKEQLKSKLSRVVGLQGYNLTDAEFDKIARLLKATSGRGGSKTDLQKIVQSVTGVQQFAIKESFDNSDLDSLIAQIIAELNK